MNIFISGFLTGFSVAAPIGPVSLICINNILARGTFFGFLSCLGASTADTIYGLVAGLGFAFVIDFSSRYHHPIQLAGGILIILIGLVKFFRDGNSDTAACDRNGSSFLRDYAVVFTSTLSNPFTVCFFLSVFSAFSEKPAGHYGGAFEYAAGIFSGTASWWLILSCTVGAFNKAISPKTIQRIRRLSALLIAAIGVYALLR